MRQLGPIDEHWRWGAAGLARALRERRSSARVVIERRLTAARLLTPVEPSW